jgi:hypothetical protein
MSGRSMFPTSPLLRRFILGRMFRGMHCSSNALEDGLTSGTKEYDLCAHVSFSATMRILYRT